MHNVKTNARGFAYIDVGSTPPWTEVVELSLDAYRDIGGRATQEAKAEQKPRLCREHKVETRRR